MPPNKQFDVDETLAKAMRTFWERGYEATSVQDLIDSTGINRGSLYGTYGDKRALFLAALGKYDKDIRRKILSELEAEHSPRHAIRELLVCFSTGLLEKGDTAGCLMTNTALELAAHDPEIRSIVAHAQEQIEDFFHRMILRGQELGEMSPALNPPRIAKGLLASLSGLLVLIRSRPDEALLASIIDDAMAKLG
ncbi:MAG: TetR family transcriptional [Beijerinckiaceae bacterium]|nr:MAG: TetR family transcriptional [Beijerinckiaceae bacterium]